MKITRNIILISDLFNQMDEQELVISKAYQRSEGLWLLEMHKFIFQQVI